MGIFGIIIQEVQCGIDIVSASIMERFGIEFTIKIEK